MRMLSLFISLQKHHVCNVCIAILLALTFKIKVSCKTIIANVVWQGGATVKLRQDENIGRNIRAMRIASHMTQEQVVAKLQLAGCDISRSIYSQIESGTYNIRISQLVALKNLFHVEYNDFFSGLDDNV